jgi:hypothetical protein
MVTVDRRGHDDLVETGRDELQRHDLSERILKGHSVRIEIDVGLTPTRFVNITSSEMAHEHFFGQGQWAVELNPTPSDSLGERRVVRKR